VTSFADDDHFCGRAHRGEPLPDDEVRRAHGHLLPEHAGRGAAAGAGVGAGAAPAAAGAGAGAGELTGAAPDEYDGAAGE
jgi:hypothetical protein